MDIKNIWKAQAVPQADLQEIKAQLSAFKTKRIRKIVFTNVSLIFTCIAVVSVGLLSQPRFVSTWTGIGLILAAMIVFLAVYNKMTPVYKSLETDMSNQEFLQILQKIKEKEKFMHKQMMNLYFVFLSSGLALYLFEYTSRMTQTWAVVAYLITLSWIALNWFVLRPMQIKKEESRLNKVIEKITSIQEQWVV